MNPIYLDYNGTTPHDPEVIQAMRPFLEVDFGNPSSSHWFGEKPKMAVSEARQQVAGLLGCRPGEIFFTSGGTESNNHSIKGIAAAYAHKGTHIITTRIEHPAVLEVCRHLEKTGYTVTYLPVNELGIVELSDLEKAATPDTTLISVMHANNEVGSIQPISEISKIAHDRGIVMHTDAAQSVGKIETNVHSLGVDLMSVAGHKIYAPKGIGALFIREGIHPQVFCHGAGQESGLRAGTENVLEIVGLGKACEVARRDMEKNRIHMGQLRDKLEQGLKNNTRRARINGHPDMRLPNTLSISFKGLAADRILEAIRHDVAASAGAACHADHVEISYVLEAMGVPEDWAKGTLRLTTGRMTTDADIDTAIRVITEAVGNETLQE